MQELLPSFAIIVFAALMHATFQLGVSVLTLLDGHSVSRKQSAARTLRLTTAFITGACITTMLLLSSISLYILHLVAHVEPVLLWSIAAGLLAGTGIAVWFFYYQAAPGTTLWIPRSLAHFLAGRAKATRASSEALSLGVTSVLAEIIFIIAPLLASALAIISLPTIWQIPAILLYVLISLAPLVVVWALMGGGHRVSDIQKWREAHKHFLQFIAAGGLIVLGFFVYVYEVIDTGGLL